MAFRRSTLSHDEETLAVTVVNDSFPDFPDWDVKTTFEGLGIFYRKELGEWRAWLPQQGNHYLKLSIIREELKDGKVVKEFPVPINGEEIFKPKVGTIISMEFEGEFEQYNHDSFYKLTILNINSDFLHPEGIKLRSNEELEKETIFLRLPSISLSPQGDAFDYQVFEMGGSHPTKPRITTWGEAKSTFKLSGGSVGIKITDVEPINLKIEENVRYRIDFNNLCHDKCDNELPDFYYYYKLIDIPRGRRKFELRPYPRIRPRGKDPLCDKIYASKLEFEDF
jgi:hypothetical protein